MIALSATETPIRPLYPPPETALNTAMSTAQERIEAATAAPVTFEDLLTAVGKTRNRDAFVRLFEHFAPRVKSFLMKGGMDEAQADDLAQDTMLAVWDKAPQYDPRKAAASTWIFTIARNRRIDRQRRLKWMEPQGDDILNNLPSAAASADDVLSGADDSRLVTAALGSLPDEQADLVRKAFYEEKSHSAIAAETGLPLGTVKSRIRLALDHLRRSLDKKGAGR